MLTAKYTHTDVGTTFERWQANNDLELGKEYPVRKVDMGGYRTDIMLVGPTGMFNSVFFDFYEDGKPINIYKSPKYNPFLRRSAAMAATDQ